jgi:hypothetical protein
MDPLMQTAYKYLQDNWKVTMIPLADESFQPKDTWLLNCWWNVANKFELKLKRQSNPWILKQSHEYYEWHDPKVIKIQEDPKRLTYGPDTNMLKRFGRVLEHNVMVSRQWYRLSLNSRSQMRGLTYSEAQVTLMFYRPGRIGIRYWWGD